MISMNIHSFPSADFTHILITFSGKERNILCNHLSTFMQHLAQAQTDNERIELLLDLMSIINEGIIEKAE